jgi:hypothetical protein
LNLEDNRLSEICQTQIKLLHDLILYVEFKKPYYTDTENEIVGPGGERKWVDTGQKIQSSRYVG